MKSLFKAVLMSGMLVSVAITARAELSAEALGTPKTMTAKQILLQQIDTVSLYLQTENIVYLPQYRESESIQIKIFFLKKGGKLSGDFRDFALRHVKAFQTGLKERLNIYTPELAQTFNGDTDLEFEIYAGTNRKLIAQVTKGSWISAKGVYVVEADPQLTEKATPVDPEKVYEEESQEQEQEKPSCPAMVGNGKAKAKKEEKSETPPKEEEVPQAEAVDGAKTPDQTANAQQPDIPRKVEEGESPREVIEISPAFKRNVPL